MYMLFLHHTCIPKHRGCVKSQTMRAFSPLLFEFWHTLLSWEILVKQHQSCKRRPANHAYRIDFHDSCSYECGGKYEYAYPELPRVDVDWREVLAVHHQQGCCRYESYNGGAQTRHYALHLRRVDVSHKQAADENHYNERREYEGEGGCGTAKSA